MNKKTNKKEKPVLSKEHFEVLLEDINGKFQFLVEGHSILNNKIDNVANELHTTKDELVDMIKWTNNRIDTTKDELAGMIQSTEERLTKKIEDGDDAVVKQLTRQIKDGDDAVVKQLTQQIKDGDDAVVKQLTRQIDEVKDILKVHSYKLDEHDERVSKLEQKG